MENKDKSKGITKKMLFVTTIVLIQILSIYNQEISLRDTKNTKEIQIVSKDYHYDKLNSSSSSNSSHHHYFTEECETNFDCLDMNSCVNGECVHNDFFPLTLRTIVGFIILFFGLCLCSAVGLGGGGLILPTLILVFNFYSHQAIPISKTIIFSNSFISFLFHLSEKHPRKNSIAVDYSIGACIIPGLLIGTIFGVFLNKLLRGILLTCLLSLLLFILAIRVSLKAFGLIKYESSQNSLDNMPLNNDDNSNNANNNDCNSKNNKEALVELSNKNSNNISLSHINSNLNNENDKKYVNSNTNKVRFNKDINTNNSNISNFNKDIRSESSSSNDLNIREYANSNIVSESMFVDNVGNIKVNNSYSTLIIPIRIMH